MNDTTPSAMDENCDESSQGVLVYHSEFIYFCVFLYKHTYAMQSIWIYDGICINEQGETAAS
jgi:hypothetical protein